ncbi:MAG: efflux RND transporter permease subunit, partial [Eubacterium sp.]|nr:efflux RND transporter permease subunit [Eubacterium sp.]
MTKFCVKKPFIIIVAVIVVMLIGGVSLSNMQTDLLPHMDLPYMLVVTTEPGASPEKIEKDVTEVLENKLGTVSGVEKIQSTSSENYSMVMLVFADDTDMNAALVRITQALETAELPEDCGKPNVMEIGMDMLATMYASVEYDGKDIKEITKFVQDTMLPNVERQEGVASVSASGTVEDSVEIRLSKKKIDKINDKILFQTNDKLEEAQKKIDDAEADLKKAKGDLEGQQNKLKNTQSDTSGKLAKGYVQISKAQATKAAYESSLNSLKASQAALQAEKKIYEDAKIEDAYNQMDSAFAQLKEQAGAMASAMGITIPGSVEEGLKDKKNLQKVIDFMKKSAPADQAKQLTVENVEQLHNVVKVRLPQIDTELANLNTEIKAAEMVVKQMGSKMGTLDESQEKLFSGAIDAAAGFGSGQAQMAAGITQIENASKELEDGKKKLEDSKKAAIENANIEKLLSLETLSGIITSQNLAMPAGYIKDKEGKQWLVKVGENYTTEKELNDMVLTKIKGIGTIRLSDVAKITKIDNAGESYAKMNGKEAVLLSIYKSSTANTSEVSDNLKDAFEEMEEQNKGLEVTPIMDQARYISQMIESLVSSILFGAALAILVLVLFLKDFKPTIIVAFSIPFSLLFAIVIMYFSGMTLNMMSLSGLCIGIGMLVDNSIVVVENVYRLRNKGISPARAAVQGAKQVAAPIVASTLTTICVFIPMVFVNGVVSQILIPFALTITYALVASL